MNKFLVIIAAFVILASCSSNPVSSSANAGGAGTVPVWIAVPESNAAIIYAQSEDGAYYVLKTGGYPYKQTLPVVTGDSTSYWNIGYKLMLTSGVRFSVTYRDRIVRDTVAIQNMIVRF